VSELAEIT